MTTETLRELARLLPSGDQTLMLLAAIGDSDVAAGAWTRWSGGAPRQLPSPERALAPYKELLPLLAWNVARHAIPVDPRILKTLQFARLTEKVRFAKYRDVCREVFAVLDETGAPFAVLKGAALGEHVYPSPDLRHCDDLDLLLERRHASRARAALVAHGWSPERGRWPAARHLPRLRHSSAMPIELHWHLFIDFYRLEFGSLWARRQPVRVAGCDVAMLSDTDALIHACAHGLAKGVNLRWVPDAWFLTRRPGGVDWPAVVERTLSSRLSVPVYTALTYLATEIGIAVPADVLHQLGAAARRAGPVEDAAARIGLRPVDPSSLLALVTDRRQLTEKIRLSRRLLFPPVATVTAEFGLPAWQLPAYYAVHLAYYAARAGQVAADRAKRAIG